MTKCSQCSRPVNGSRSDTKTCSPRCRKRAERARRREAETAALATASTPVAEGDVYATPGGATITPGVTFHTRLPHPLGPCTGLEKAPVRVPTAVDDWGHPTDFVDAEQEAAAHWDARQWREVR
jgi:hypothetical protein